MHMPSDRHSLLVCDCLARRSGDSVVKSARHFKMLGTSGAWKDQLLTIELRDGDEEEEAMAISQIAGASAAVALRTNSSGTSRRMERLTEASMKNSATEVASRFQRIEQDEMGPSTSSSSSPCPQISLVLNLWLNNWWPSSLHLFRSCCGPHL
ncbi:hypothetical protein OPV22_020132 [Ensete ventricosum]|uniref:Uncharacterized protein n=1 Tax=Ensete ventricosum TaxID=4639 RepID=A0AAV8P9X8_ENSVE|nr:hypothetical protein OPV22_020132 [Ensete ventricosum]